MIVDRTVVLSNVEPAALSFRAPVGLEVKLDIRFFNQLGQSWTQDLAAQLQLTGRSTARTATYHMPASDVVNGKARAIIPADSLTDPQGYRARIIGTMNGEPSLLAVGTVQPIAAAGFEILPVDVIDTVDLAFERGEIAEMDVKLWDDIGKTDPFDLTVSTVTAYVYASAGGAMLTPFTVAVTGANTVNLSLTVDQVNGLPDQCWWSLSVASSVGLTTLCQGNVTVMGAV